MTPYDVAVVGLGAMGSMIALELARGGRRVIGFDRYRPPHAQGSSHGETRIIREAYFEHPQYVPLVQLAYEKWAALERDGGRRLLARTGGVMIGDPKGLLVAGARRSALEHGLEYQEVTAAEVMRRFPVFRPPAGAVGLIEPRAGVLFPEEAVAAGLELAARAGAELRFDEPVLEWRRGPVLEIRTAAGRFTAERLVLAAGAWLAGPLAGASLPLTVARQTLFWFRPADPAAAAPDRMPVFIWEWEPGRMFYGFPDFGGGVKLAIHHQGEPADPETVSRLTRPGEERRLRDLLPERTPALAGDFLRGAVCLYTNTSDGDFLVDAHPDDARVTLVSPCSGHGFKFAPAIGELVAGEVMGRGPPPLLSPFRLRRFTPANGQ